ncbi:MAG: metal-dependent hydrolase [Patescibacteria group bacterium]|nr:metal-dependent hydrolase [Patescibacteria group bacterium]
MPVKLTYLGHAAVLLQGTKTVIIDPFLTGNPKASIGAGNLPKIDYVLVTHDHYDHLGDAFDIAKKHKAALVAIFEIVQLPAAKKIHPQSIGMNIGGTIEAEGIRISMTPALHSAGVGAPAGFVVELDGKRIYHGGDTAFFSDMAYIPKFFGKLDVTLVPMGGYFGMDARQAAEAVKLLKPKTAIPIHYDTWPLIHTDPAEFRNQCRPTDVRILLPGNDIVI